MGNEGKSTVSNIQVHLSKICCRSWLILMILQSHRYQLLRFHLEKLLHGSDLDERWEWKEIMEMTMT